jgi:hypothetical protein
MSNCFRFKNNITQFLIADDKQSQAQSKEEVDKLIVTEISYGWDNVQPNQALPISTDNLEFLRRIVFH